MPNKSSRKTRASNSRALSKPRAERFLLALANLRGAWPLDENDGVELKRTIEALDQFRRLYADVLVDSEPIGILILRDFVRRAWNASDARQLDWWAFQFRNYSQKMTKRVSEVRLPPNSEPLAQVPSSLAITFSEAAAIIAQAEPVRLTPLEEVGMRLAQLMRRAKRCANPDCQVEPYFFLKKKGQKFCSETCSIPAQRAAKLRWWRENRQTKTKMKGASKWKRMKNSAGKVSRTR